MSKNICLIILAFGILFFSAASANAQSLELNSSPRVFKIFFLKFKKAVEKKDKTAIVSMTRFPFKYGFDAGDEGTLTRTQFINKYGEMFERLFKAFVSDKKLVFSKVGNSYSLSDDTATHFEFRRIGNNFKLRAVLVEP